MGKGPASPDRRTRSVYVDDGSGVRKLRREVLNADAFDPAHTSEEDSGRKIHRYDGPRQSQASILRCPAQAPISNSSEKDKGYHSSLVSEELANVYDLAGPHFNVAVIDERELNLCGHTTASPPLPLNQYQQPSECVDAEIKDCSHTPLMDSMMSESNWSGKSVNGIDTSKLIKRYPDRDRALIKQYPRWMRTVLPTTSSGDYPRYRRSKPAPLNSRTWFERRAIRKRVEARARRLRREEMQQEREEQHPRNWRISADSRPSKLSVKSIEGSLSVVQKPDHSNYADWMKLSGMQPGKILSKQSFMRLSRRLGLRERQRFSLPDSSSTFRPSPVSRTSQHDHRGSR